jgi:hypothetical protein
MTDSASTEKRTHWIVAIAAVLLIGAFSSIYVFSHRPKKARAAAELVQELKTINPPEGTQEVGIAPLNPQPSPYFVTVIANYTSDSTCQAIAEHYKREFALRGFDHQIRDNEKPDSEAMSFCGHETHGSFSCISGARGQHYLISLKWPEDTWVTC